MDILKDSNDFLSLRHLAEMAIPEALSDFPFVYAVMRGFQEIFEAADDGFRDAIFSETDRTFAKLRTFPEYQDNSRALREIAAYKAETEKDWDFRLKSS